MAKRHIVYSYKGKGSLNMNEIIVKFSSYLKAHNIQFKQDMTDDGIPQITMKFHNCDMCPGEITEGCIFFYDDGMEVRVYYSELGAEMCRTSEKRPELYRFMNFLQARVWPRAADGMDGRLYSSQYLFCPRFYVTEDEMYDITATMLVPYTYYELDELETEDFITAALPDLMNRLSIPIFFILAGKITADKAIEMVKKDILSGTNTYLAKGAGSGNGTGKRNVLGWKRSKNILPLLKEWYNDNKEILR